MSRFTDKILQPESTCIDFSKATKLLGGGSTCDIYITTLHRRKVFVKRIKEELRDMPVYRAAFDKEYDIGVNLKHKSLPEYREFGGDYIVMDYIEGSTLADLIKNKDLWLTKEKNIIKILQDLLDVIDYLHQHNIVHCDIKADNIMITAGIRNLMLIDLDKCYTDWFNDTSGAASKFGLSLEKTGNVTLDFHGIGQIVELLIKTVTALKSKRLYIFKECCFKDNVDIDELKSLLEPPKSQIKYWFMTFPLFALIIAGTIIWNPVKGTQEESQFLTYNESVKKDTVVVIQHQHDIPENIESNQSPPHKEEKNKMQATYKEIIEQELPNRFDTFYELLDDVESKFSNPDISDDEFIQLSFDMAMLHSDLLQKTYKYYEDKFSEIPYMDVQMAIATSKSLKEVNSRWDKVQQMITNIVDSRHEVNP